MRVFLGFSLRADWPQVFPDARILRKSDRHITVAFLGEVTAEQLETLRFAPLPDFQSSPAGIFDTVLFLPSRKSTVVAWHARFLREAEEVFLYHKILNEWLEGEEFQRDYRPFLPHVTLARAPFKKREWSEQFKPIEFQVKGLHCYQSLGDSCYKVLWTLRFY